jgi:hypothetical protein
MTPRTKELLSGLERVPVAATEAAEPAGSLPRDVPPDYKEATLQNGWRGFLSEASPYVELWPVPDVMATNAQYEVLPDRDEMLLIGSDGGGTAYAMVRVAERWVFADVPFVPLKASEARLRGDSFEGFLEDLAKGGHLKKR